MSLMSKSHPVAVAVADLHLSLTAPACRADKDWLAVQAGYLQQLKDLAQDLPILCAGDLFDRWNTPPELLHFALEYLPDGMICVPGQHDLPNHRMEDLHRCGYGVLAKAGKIRDITGGMPYVTEEGIYVQGFGWGQEISGTKSGWEDTIRIALIHRYCWTEGREFPGAPAEAHLNALPPAIRSYSLAVFGDNHKSFVKYNKKFTVVNCGGFIRRKSDEIPYHPCVSVLYNDGSVRQQPLDIANDQFYEDAKQREESELDLQGFLNSLEGLGEHGLNFKEAVENHLRREGLRKSVHQIILQCLNSHE